MLRKREKSETRTLDQLRESYEIEKELASRLRSASKQERRYLYSILYDEWSRRVPLQPQLRRKLSLEDTARVVYSQILILRSFLRRDSTFLEIGSGDCALSVEVANLVRKVYAVDVSKEATKNLIFPQNFELILSDGCSIPVPECSINIAFSYQLMEHLHPDDAFELNQNIYKALRPGGVYICITPNRLCGPHDISKYFDRFATGFHLREYSNSELNHLFRLIGFSKVRIYIGASGYYSYFPLFLVELFESFLDTLPYPLRSVIARGLPSRLFLGVRMIAIK